jgi:hypothetical protein
MYPLEIREEIDSATEHYASILPREIANLAELAELSLIDGPLYLDEEGEQASPFDDGAKPFPWESALAKISDWAETVEDISISSFEIDEEGEEIEISETVPDSRQAILASLFGKHLAEYL